jgi:hypothetical protein
MTREKGAGGTTWAGSEQLPSKWEALSSNLSTTKKKNWGTNRKMPSIAYVTGTNSVYVPKFLTVCIRKTGSQKQTWSYINWYIEHVCSNGTTLWEGGKGKDNDRASTIL